MKTQAIVEMMTTKVKSILQNPSEQLEQPLGIENVESVIKIIGQAVTQAISEGLKSTSNNPEKFRGIFTKPQRCNILIGYSSFLQVIHHVES